MTTLLKSIVFLSLICCATGCCYRMPEEDEFSLIPATNNPSYTKEKANAAPGIGY